MNQLIPPDEPLQNTLQKPHPLLLITLIAVQSIWSNNNNNTPSTQSSPLPLHLNNLPLLDFIHRVLRRSRTNPNTLKICLFYLHQARRAIRQRISVADRKKLSSPHPFLDHDPALSGEKMFVAALMLASKFLQDRNFSNRAWAKIAGFSIKDLNANERVFLSLIEYRSHVNLSAFVTWCARLQKLMDERNISRPTSELESTATQIDPLNIHRTSFKFPSAPSTTVSLPSSYPSQRRQSLHTSTLSTSSATLAPQLSLSHDSSRNLQQPIPSHRRPSMDEFVTPVRQNTHPLLSSRVISATAPSRLNLSDESVSRTAGDSSLAHQSSDFVTPTHSKTISHTNLTTAPAHIKSSQVAPSTSRLASETTPAHQTTSSPLSQSHPLKTSIFLPDRSTKQELCNTPTKAVVSQSVSPLSIRNHKKTILPTSDNLLTRRHTLNGTPSVERQDEVSSINDRLINGSPVELVTSLDHITTPDVAKAERSLLEKIAKENMLLAKEEAEASLRSEAFTDQVMTAEQLRQKHLDLLAQERRLKEEERRLKEQERRLLEEQLKLKAEQLRLKKEREEEVEKRERLRRLVDTKPKLEHVALPDVLPPPSQRLKTPIVSPLQRRGFDESIGIEQDVDGEKSSDHDSNLGWKNELQEQHVPFDKKDQNLDKDDLSDDNPDRDSPHDQREDITTSDHCCHPSCSSNQTRDYDHDQEGLEDFVWRGNHGDHESSKPLNIELRRAASEINAKNSIASTNYLHQKSNSSPRRRSYGDEKQKQDWNHQDNTVDHSHRSFQAQGGSDLGWANNYEENSISLNIEARQRVSSSDHDRLVSKNHHDHHHQQQLRNTPAGRRGSRLDDTQYQSKETRAEEDEVMVTQRSKQIELERIKTSSDPDPDQSKCKSSSSSPPPSLSSNVRPSLMAKLEEEQSKYGYPKKPERNLESKVEKSCNLLPAHQTPSTFDQPLSKAISSIGHDPPSSSHLTTVPLNRVNPSNLTNSHGYNHQKNHNYNHHRPPLQISQRSLNSCAFQENHGYVNPPYYSHSRTGLMDKSIRSSSSAVGSLGQFSSRDNSSSIDRRRDDDQVYRSCNFPSTPSHSSRTEIGTEQVNNFKDYYVKNSNDSLTNDKEELHDRRNDDDDYPYYNKLDNRLLASSHNSTSLNHSNSYNHHRYQYPSSSTPNHHHHHHLSPSSLNHLYHYYPDPIINQHSSKHYSLYNSHPIPSNPSLSSSFSAENTNSINDSSAFNYHHLTNHHISRPHAKPVY